MFDDNCNGPITVFRTHTLVLRGPPEPVLLNYLFMHCLHIYLFHQGSHVNHLCCGVGHLRFKSDIQIYKSVM